MDGNGRWARMRGLPRTEGHRAGARAARAAISECRRRGVEALTLYAFSSENWSRPKLEITALFSLLVEFLNKETPELVSQGIRLNVIGDIDGLPLPQRVALRQAMERSAACDKMLLNLALNYGARAEIVRAARLAMASGLAPEELTEASFSGYLHTAGMPDPDLLIRSGGEERLSNFLLYQCAYSELYFTPTLWPDFDEAELAKAFEAFASRERRFGKTGEQIARGGANGG